MKKVLFTIQWFPSVLSANALCDEKIINLLKTDKEYDISCLTYRSNGQEIVSVYDNVKIFRFRRSWWWNAVVKANQQKNFISDLVLKFNLILLRIKQILTIPCYPVVDIKSCIKFAYNAYKLHKIHNYDIVISEHHGFDSLFAGFFLKKMFPDIKFVAILWDPISAKEPVRYLPAAYSANRSIATEKMLLKYADFVIGMKSSETTVSGFNLGYDDKHKFFDIPGIIEQTGTGYKCDKLKEGYINIVYSGILSLPDRDPSYILDLLNICSVADKINIVFFCTGAGRQVLEKKKASFKGCISICDYIPHEDLISVYKDSNILLNFGGVNANMVPSKIFEYMSICKPVISTFKIDNEASKGYFDKYPLAFCVDERKELEHNSMLLEKFLSSYCDIHLSFADIENTFPINTPSVYIDLINQL